MVCSIIILGDSQKKSIIFCLVRPIAQPNPHGRTNLEENMVWNFVLAGSLVYNKVVI